MAARTPDYQRIADDLREKIRAGRYAPGQKLPTKRELATEYGVSLQPVAQALFRLSLEGWVSGHQGKGTFVADSLPG